MIVQKTTLSKAKSKLSELARKVSKSNKPVLMTSNGVGKIVAISVKEFEKLTGEELMSIEGKDFFDN